MKFSLAAMGEEDEGRDMRSRPFMQQPIFAYGIRRAQSSSPPCHADRIEDFMKDAIF